MATACALMQPVQPHFSVNFIRGKISSSLAFKAGVNGAANFLGLTGTQHGPSFSFYAYKLNRGHKYEKILSSYVVSPAEYSGCFH